MNEVNHKKIIQETIEDIRKRKSRPNLERIAKIIERRYGVPFHVIAREIELMVEQRIIFRIEYRGKVSYRNNFTMSARNPNVTYVPGSNNKTVPTKGACIASDILLRAVGSQLMVKPFPEEGVTLDDIHRYIESRYGPTGHLGLINVQALNIALFREVEAGRIFKLSSGNYTLNKASSPIISDCMNTFYNALEMIPKTSGAYMADHPHVPTTKKIAGHKEDANASPDCRKCDICDVALEADASIFECQNCHYVQAHQKCVHHPNYLQDAAANESTTTTTNAVQWCCKKCRKCCICDQTSKGDPMILCPVCDRSYHTRCHWPQITEEWIRNNGDKWACGQCTFPETTDSDDAISNSQQWEENEDFVPARSNADEADPQSATKMPNADGQDMDDASPVISPREDIIQPLNNASGDIPSYDADKPVDFSTSMSISSITKSLENYPQVVPDVRQWTVEEVEHFVSCIGFPREAQLFRDHGIDGTALLLLQRSDVISSPVLNIKLGPALKLFRHIIHLQSALKSYPADSHSIIKSNTSL